MSAAILLALALAQIEPTIGPGILLPGGPSDPNAHLIVSRAYTIRHLGPGEVVRLARSACRDITRSVCTWSIRGQELELRADEWAQARFADLLRDQDAAEQTFEILLLSALREGSPPDGLPAHARKALADVAEILPFKGFRLLGSAVVRARRTATARLEEAPQYTATLEFTGDPEQSGALLVKRFQLVRRVRRSQDGRAEEVKTTLVSGTFSIVLGETAVVGASKPEGGSEALLVLFTARAPAAGTQPPLPRSAAAPR